MNSKLKEIIDDIESKGHKVLYVTEFGSTLYGLNDKSSDVDLRGIFLPSIESLILQTAPKSFNYSSGENDSKNTAEDIDIGFYSLQYWLNLIQKGEINALDILYSCTHEKCIIFKDEKMNDIFNNYNKLFNSNKTKSYIGYAIGQAKKYGIRGSRLGVFKKIKECIEKIKYEEKDLLKEYISYIVENCGHEKYCFKKELNNIESIIVCDKSHIGNILFKDFCKRILKEYNKYGKRAELAMVNENLDFKALSHAYRALIQIKSIILTGKVEFPLVEGKDTAYAIKKGKMPWVIVEKLLTELIDEVTILQDSEPQINRYNSKFVNKLILGMYND